MKNYNIYTYYAGSGLYLFNALPDSYSSLNYDSEKHKYSGTTTIDGEVIAYEFYAQDGHIIEYTVKTDSMWTMKLSDFGKVTIDLPEKYEEY